MSKARKDKKRAGLIAIQTGLVRRDWDEDVEIQSWVDWDRFLLVELDTMSPIERIAQERHEMRVFGHNVGAECGCTPDDVTNLILWNQPFKLWMGSAAGDRYSRKIRSRRERR